MKVLFLGTGAADWDISAPERPEGFRRFSSALIDGELLIDPGPCVFEAAAAFGVDTAAIKYIINTHSHADHYCQETVDRLTASGAEFIRMAAGDKLNLGRYNITALPASHGTAAEAVHFLISDGESSVLYALDGAWLTYAEVSAIRSTHTKLAVLDATIGDIKGDYRIFEHNNLAMVEEIKASLEAYIDRFIISHMAKTLHTDHKTLVNRMAKSGIEVAYDGLEVEI